MELKRIIFSGKGRLYSNLKTVMFEYTNIMRSASIIQLLEAINFVVKRRLLQLMGKGLDFRRI